LTTLSGGLSEADLSDDSEVVGVSLEEPTELDIEEWEPLVDIDEPLAEKFRGAGRTAAMVGVPLSKPGDSAHRIGALRKTTDVSVAGTEDVDAMASTTSVSCFFVGGGDSE
jgi:hypothetical protein